MAFFALGTSATTAAPIWANPGSGNWFDAANWNPAAVPVAGDAAIVSNGGTAQLAGGGTTPVLGSLSIGIGSSGTGVGTVQSNLVNIRSGSLNIGTIFTTGATANGALTVMGAGVETNSASVGTAVNAPGAVSASGTVSVTGSVPFTGGALLAGQMFESGRGSSVSGQVTIGGDAGTVGNLLIAGNVSASDSSRIGSSAKGQIDIGENLDLAPGTGVFIGTTFGPAHAVDGADSFVNRASGAVNIGGTMRLLGAPNTIAIGTTGDGVVDGSLIAGVLDMNATARINTLSIGTSNAGQATGTMSIGGGNLFVGNLAVGTTNTGSAHGTLNVGGVVTGNNSGALRVGIAGGDGSIVNAIGSINASGVGGFSSYNVGVLSNTVGAGSVAQGTVISNGAAVSSTTGSVTVGLLTNTPGSAAASGVLSHDGSLMLSGGALLAGQMFESGRGSSVSGQVTIGGDAGTVGNLLIAGNVSASDSSRIGSSAKGQIDIGENLDLAPGTGVFIGTTFGPAHAVDGADSFVNRASGAVNIGGTMRLLGAPNTIAIGTTGDGVVDGSLIAGVLDMNATARINTLSIGTSNAGQATGTMSIGGGNLFVGNLAVGTTNTGSAHGTLNVGGVVTGNNSGALRVGIAGGDGSIVNAIGSINASGVGGFSSYNVGVLSNTVGAGSVAQGTVISNGAAVSSTTGSVTVGLLTNTPGSAAASGVLSHDGSLMLSGGALLAGQMFESGRGSSVSGQVTIGGDAGTVGNLLIAGNVSASDSSRIGSSAKGQIDIGENLDLAPGTGVFIGTTFGPAHAVDGADSFVNRASGAVNIGGTMRLLGAPNTIAIGTTGDGVVDGSLIAGVLDMNATARINTLSIGTSNAGQATGTMSIGGGNLFVGDVSLGKSTTGSAEGTLQLQTANLVADNVVAGSGPGGRAEISVRDSTALITDSFTLTNGELLLDNSLLSVGNEFALGAGATLEIDIDGLLRGFQYGAIDVRSALLDGVLAIDLLDLAFVGDLMVFDLLRSEGADGIQGDFDSFLFTGLQSGYSALARVELEGAEVYRLRIMREAVPEPSTGALLLGALLAMLAVRRSVPTV